MPVLSGPPGGLGEVSPSSQASRDILQVIYFCLYCKDFINLIHLLFIKPRIYQTCKFGLLKFHLTYLLSFRIPIQCYFYALFTIHDTSHVVSHSRDALIDSIMVIMVKHGIRDVEDM